MHPLLSVSIVLMALFKTSGTQSLCDGSLTQQGVGFNPYPGNCREFVQCWIQGKTVMSLVLSCPFGQFWDAEAITCRPSFLVACTADPCMQSTPISTYGAEEYGCRTYWECIDGVSVPRCCPKGYAYVDDSGCVVDAICDQECPSSGGIAVKHKLNRRPVLQEDHTKVKSSSINI